MFCGRKRRHSGGTNPGHVIAAIGLGMMLAYIVPVFALFVIVGLSLIGFGIYLACRCRK